MIAKPPAVAASTFMNSARIERREVKTKGRVVMIMAPRDLTLQLPTACAHAHACTTLVATDGTTNLHGPACCICAPGSASRCRTR